MPDVVDAADQTIELELQAHIAAVRKHTGAPLQARGACHNCEAALEPGKLFCAALPPDPLKPRASEISECQEDYERRARRARQWA
jgi:hypothetical protein